MKLSLIGENTKNKKLFEAVQVEEDAEPAAVEPMEVDIPEDNITIDENPIPSDENIEDVADNAEVDNYNNNLELENQIKSVIDALWQLRSQLSIISESFLDKENIRSILNGICDDTAISIGMLYKVSELINPELSLLINKGQNKATETVINKE